MRRVELWPIARNFIEMLPLKHQRQIASKIELLRENPEAPRSKILAQFSPLRRYRSGNYRIVYKATEELLTIVLVDKRNDDAIYRRLKQMFR